MNPVRILAIAKKEVFHIMRDPFTLSLAVMLPLILVLIFGLAIELNVSNIPIAVFDNDKTSASRQLIDIMGSSKFFLPYYASSPKDAVHELDAGRAKAALIIDHSFQKNISSGKQSPVQVLLDASDSSTVISTIGYLNTMQDIINKRIAGKTPDKKIEIKTRFLYNPELNSRWFIVPGLIVIILSILSVILTALTVAREWENGSMELLLSTPAEPFDIIIGKLAPYIALCLLSVFFVYLMARLLLGVPFAGSHFLFLGGCILFISTCLALGLLISVVTRDQRTAMQISLVASLLPSILLSGFIFPVQSMPAFFRALTTILPARWFMIICRNCFLKNMDLISLRAPFLALFIMTLVLANIAAKKFKKDLEP